jgi:hypothetical protein
MSGVTDGSGDSGSVHESDAGSENDQSSGTASEFSY